MSFQFDDELYRDIILDHYRNPRNDGETVKELHFSGRGCSISQASASMMAEEIEGKPLPEALKIKRNRPGRPGFVFAATFA